jgi:hypothetical protein
VSAPSWPSTHTGFDVDQEQDIAAGAVDPMVPPVPPDQNVMVDVQKPVEPVSSADGAAGAAVAGNDVQEPVDEQEQIEAALAEHAELHPIARPAVAVLLAGERRPLPVVHRAIGELAEAVRSAAAVGERWTPATLTRKARAFVRLAYDDPTSSTSTRSTTSWPPSPPPRPPSTPRPTPLAPAETVQNIRSLLAAIGSTRPTRPS